MLHIVLIPSFLTSSSKNPLNTSKLLMEEHSISALCSCFTSPKHRSAQLSLTFPTSPLLTVGAWLSCPHTRIQCRWRSFKDAAASDVTQEWHLKDTQDTLKYPKRHWISMAKLLGHSVSCNNMLHCTLLETDHTPLLFLTVSNGR